MKEFINRNAYLLIALIPVSIYVVSYYLFELNAETSLTIKTLIVEAIRNHPITPSYTFIEYKSRILWLSSSLLSIIAYGIALTWSAIIFIRCCRRDYWVNLIVVGLAIITMTLIQIGKSDSASAMYNNIFDTTYQALKVCPLVSQATLNKVYTVISTINLLAAVTPVFILMAISCLIALPPENEKAGSLVLFAEHMNYLKQGIMIGSLVLLFGIIHMDTWMQWPIAMLEDSEFKTAVLASLTAISQFWGIAFSLLLFSLYAAAALYWRHRTRIFLSASEPDIEVSTWLDNHGFTFSWHKHALQLSAMLTPFLAGSFNTGMELLSLN
jgi:hypothetical protein